MNTTYETALQWRALGIACLPILAGSKKPAIDKWGHLQERLPRLQELAAWFDGTGYGIAAITGWQGLVVLDFDNHWQQSVWLAGLSPSLAAMALSTYRVSTSRGCHYYFYVKEPTQSMPLDGMDVKAGGGYVIVSPSWHPSGVQYVSIGQPSQIKSIRSIEELLPEALRVKKSLLAGNSWGGGDLKRGGGNDYDPFDDAMCSTATSSIEEIKARWSFADLLQINGKSRRGVTMINCPLHNDTHASFAIYPDNHWHCFGCSAHGRDIIGLYAALHNMSNADAIRAMSKK